MGGIATVQYRHGPLGNNDLGDSATYYIVEMSNRPIYLQAAARKAFDLGPRVARMKNDPDFAALMLLNLSTNVPLFKPDPSVYIQTSGGDGAERDVYCYDYGANSTKPLHRFAASHS